MAQFATFSIFNSY